MSSNEYPNGWNVTLEPDHVGMFHVFPINDLKEHTCVDCWCKPEVDNEAPGLLVHNSMDKREEYEEGRKPS